MRCLYTLTLLFVVSFNTYCQISDNFSDGDYDMNPTWIDTASHFIVNDEQMLQLNAPEAGFSFIHTPVSLEDSIRWSSYCLMDFSPSGSNLLRIYLASDNLAIELGNSLYFEIGETGSEDALHLIENNSGLKTVHASATMGALGSEPAEFKFILEKTSDNMWSLFVDYNQTGSQLEWEMNLEIPWLAQSQLFGYYMQYTSSRTDKFFFDDVLVEPLLPDTTPPELSSVSLVSSSQIDLIFTEAMDFDQLQDLGNYTISPDLASPTSVNVDPENTSVCSLNYTGNELQSGVTYNLSVENISDVAGNTMIASQHPLQLVEPALPDDIFVNEILFNPDTGGFDYVEIYNASNKLIDISSLILANIQKNSYEDIDAEGVFLPGEYLVIAPDADWLAQNYNVMYPERVIENKIPSFNDDSGNVSILSRQITGVRILSDSLDYDEDWHYILIDDEEGVSLEKISPSIETNDSASWHSASENSGFGTPGYANSQFIGSLNSETEFSLQEKVFSPNQDGDNDRLLINYSLDRPGYLATVKVYNDRGFLITELSNNFLLSQQGVIAWDGTKNDSQRASIGIYVIVYELFHPDGDTKQGKLSCVLADFLD